MKMNCLDVPGRRPVPGSAIPNHFKLVEIHPMRTSEKKKRKVVMANSSVIMEKPCKDDENEFPDPEDKVRRNKDTNKLQPRPDASSMKENIQSEYFSSLNHLDAGMCWKM